MDPTVAFGAFTYERDGTGDTKNPNRELDLAEISRWGRRDNAACRIDPQALCEGNSQFALQLWWHPSTDEERTEAAKSGKDAAPAAQRQAVHDSRQPE
jgi:hypothetical protein